MTDLTEKAKMLEGQVFVMDKHTLFKTIEDVMVISGLTLTRANGIIPIYDQLSLYQGAVSMAGTIMSALNLIDDMGATQEDLQKYQSRAVITMKNIFTNGGKDD